MYDHQQTRLEALGDPPPLQPERDSPRVIDCSEVLSWARACFGGQGSSAHKDGVSPTSMSWLEKTLPPPIITQFFEKSIVVVSAPRKNGKTMMAPYIALECANIWRKEHQQVGEACYTNPHSSNKFIVVCGCLNSAISLQDYYKEIYPHLVVDVAWDANGLNKSDLEGTDRNNYQKVVRKQNRDLGSLRTPAGYIVSAHVAAEVLRQGFIGSVFVDNADSCLATVAVTQLLNVAADGLRRHDRSPQQDRSWRRIGKIFLFVTSDGKKPDVKEGEMRLADRSFDLIEVVDKFVSSNKNMKFGNIIMFKTNSFAVPRQNTCIYEVDNFDSGLQSKKPPWQPTPMMDPMGAAVRAATNSAVGNTHDLIMFERKGRLVSGDEPDIRNNKLLLTKAYHLAMKYTATYFAMESTRSEAAAVQKQVETNAYRQEPIRLSMPSILVICSSPEQATALASDAMNAPDIYMYLGEDGFYYNGKPPRGSSTRAYTQMWTVQRHSIRGKYESYVNYKCGHRIDRHVKGIFPEVMCAGRLIFATFETAATLHIPNLALTVATADIYRHASFAFNGLITPYDRFADKWELEEMGNVMTANGFFVLANSTHQVRRSLGSSSRMLQFLQDKYTLNDFLDILIVQAGDVETYGHVGNKTYSASNPPIVPAFMPNTYHEARMIDACRVMGLLRSSPLPNSPNAPDQYTLFIMRVFPDLPIEYGKLILIGVHLGVARQVITIAAMFLSEERACQQAHNADDSKSGATYQEPLVDLFHDVISNCVNGSPTDLVGVPTPTSEWVANAELWSNFLFCTKWNTSTLVRPRRYFCDSKGATRDPSQSMDASAQDCNFWTPDGWSQSRDAFEQNVKKICNALVVHGLVDSTDPFNSGTHNRHTLNSVTSLLSHRGVAILSAAIAMSMPYVAQHDGRNRIEGAEGPGAFYPIRWKVFNRSFSTFVHVSGFSKLESKYRYTIYSPSHSGPISARGVRYKCNIMPISAFNLLMFCNSGIGLDGKVDGETTTLTLKTRGKPTKDDYNMKFDTNGRLLHKVCQVLNFVEKVLHNSISYPIRDRQSINHDVDRYIADAWAAGDIHHH